MPRSTRTTKPASPAQIDLITRLLGEKVVPAEHPVRSADLATMTSRMASATIDWMFTLPRTEQAASTKAEPGYYTKAEDGETAFFLVVENRAKTGTYAKRLVLVEGSKPRWEYAPGVGKTLAGLTPLTVQQAAEFGHMHGYCIRGFERLTDPVSVIMGYGETCAGHEGWPYPKGVAAKRALIASAA